MLGGNAEFLAVQQMAKIGLTLDEQPEEYEAKWDEVFDGLKKEVATEAAKVLEVGGLYVLGTERTNQGESIISFEAALDARVTRENRVSIFR